MTVKAEDRDPEKICNVSDCSGWRTGDSRFCHHHQGLDTPENNDRAVSHGLYQSKEVFLENAEEHHRDRYHAIHESLCSDYERQHGYLPVHIKKRLADIALDMVRIDMGDEYEAENAVDPQKPLTEKERKMSEAGPWEKEVTSKVEQIKTNISRETRLALKDMGIYRSPEAQQAQAARELGDVVKEALEPQD
jgi:hypothetical protein